MFGLWGGAVSMETKQEAVNKISEVLNKLYKECGFDSNDTAKAVFFFNASVELEHATKEVWQAAETNTKFNLIGIFHAAMADMYGKELADMMMMRVNAFYKEKYTLPTETEKECKCNAGFGVPEKIFLNAACPTHGETEKEKDEK
jgi:hypothetical protein